MTRDEIVTALRCHYDAIETGLNPRNFYDLEKLLAMIDTQGS